MKGLRLYKKEKLCSIKAIDSLFHHSMDAGRSGTMAYPWRAVWRMRDDDTDSAAAPMVSRFVISVPKKRVRHAVDRVRLRRLCREAYRLSRHMLPELHPVDIAFVYVGERKIADYDTTLRSMHKIMERINRSVTPPQPIDNHDEIF
ncbi:MAG: ribonuclease P protein component [Muribaculaceae bacterium]|nr:ribonuclease P protein component [Muribaculaceae bacterium]